jgi:excinuclease ABC subunit A
VIRVEMHFLPDVHVQCEVCRGRRYNRETLEIRYKGRSIDEVLNLTIEEALEFFAPVPVIARKLQTLMDVGLSYVQLGQSATTLSGGEAQRVKLSRRTLQARHRAHALHPRRADHRAAFPRRHNICSKCCMRLRDQGNTVVVIEHNLDVIKTADWIIDLGPEGGDGAGRVVAVGTPETIAADVRSHTGRFLRPLLERGW